MFYQSPPKKARDQEGPDALVHFVLALCAGAKAFGLLFYNGLYYVARTLPRTTVVLTLLFAVASAVTVTWIPRLAVKIAYYLDYLFPVRWLDEPWDFVRLTTALFVFLYIVYHGAYWFRRKKTIADRFSVLGFKRGDKPVSLSWEGKNYWLLKNQGFSLEDFQKKIPQIEAMFDVAIHSVQFDGTRGGVLFKFGKGMLSDEIGYDLFYRQNVPSNTFGIGQAATGPMFKKLENMVHVLVAGETGSGKSSFLRQLIVSLLTYSTDVRLVLIDLKRGLEFTTFRGHTSVEFAENVSEAHAYLSKLTQEMDRRADLFKKEGVVNLEAYNRQVHEKLPRFVVVVDESAELFTSQGLDREERSLIAECRTLTQRLARLARASGIHLVLATQRPDVSSLDGKIQANLGTRICFKTSSDRVSVMALGVGGAEKLPDIPGRALYKDGTRLVEVQVPYLSEERIKEKI